MPVETTDKFPNWKLVPKTEQAGDVIFDWDCMEFNSAITSLFRAFPSFTALDIGYVKPITLGEDTWQVLWKGATSQVKFQAGDMLAIVMPMNSKTTVSGLKTILEPASVIAMAEAAEEKAA